jgi:hypothetical protein
LYRCFAKFARHDGYQMLPGGGRFGQVWIYLQFGMFRARQLN